MFELFNVKDNKKLACMSLEIRWWIRSIKWQNLRKFDVHLLPGDCITARPDLTL